MPDEEDDSWLDEPPADDAAPASQLSAGDNHINMRSDTLKYPLLDDKTVLENMVHPVDGLGSRDHNGMARNENVDDNDFSMDF